jgi:predicted nucleic acid-binding protein
VIVVDSNVLAYLLIAGPRTPQAVAALRRDPDWHMPRLWRSEMRNVLVPRVRTGAADLREAEIVLQKALALLGEREHEVGDRPVLSLAASSGCTAYDCEFVALAQALGVPLVTCDGEVLRAFPGVAVALEAFSAGGAGW